MTYLQDKINTFYKKRNEIFKKPLQKVINTMLDKCKYANGESLERHNWGNDPIALQNIPKNLNIPSFEDDLLNALNLEDNEKSIVELLWGDIQLGKRVQACIIMWISVHILKRPVLYIFRNLRIDQKQLHDDIVGTENYNFNIQFIKTLFQEFNNELQEYFNENNVEYWKDYKLPELKDINSNDIINKLSNKEAINSNDVFCCLMNNTQLAKINAKFSEYIYYNNHLVNITLLVDESDLMSPTSSNDRTHDNDKKDSTACEILLAKIYKKVKYALHITGTAHSLLYNVTTRLSDHTDIQMKISKVHKMKRSSDYFGLFNNSINFDTTLVQPWWEYRDTENHNKKTHYDIVEDYNINIKQIITKIIERNTIKYNSLLISEEKIRINQFYLVDKIIRDFPNIFIIIYHGNCLRLYFSKDYEEEIKRLSKWDSEQSSTSQRLWQVGGVYDSPIDSEKSEKLPNNYCYYNIDTKLLNIKLIYKLLRILFETNIENIIHKTIITITGKYGERGYSFTSDDYDNYSLHLTDQYFVSHASFNCTDISQRLRLQGKYNDLKFNNRNMNLTLWTTPEVQDIIQNFYVKFIKEIEKYIMGCESWEEIKDLLESIIDNGDFKFGKYMKYIDVSKKKKNIKPIKYYDRKHNGYRLIIIDDMSDIDIYNWCKESNLPDYNCINSIEEMSVCEFIDNYGTWEYELEEKIEEFDSEKHYLNFIEKNKLPLSNYKNKKEYLFYKTNVAGDTKIYQYESLRYELSKMSKGSNLGITHIGNGEKINNIKTRLYISYKDITNAESIVFTLRLCKVIQKNKVLPKTTNNYIQKTPYYVIDDKVKYSVLKDKYKNESDNDLTENNIFPEKYYWKTPDDWLYLYDKNKPEIISLYIVNPTPVKFFTQPTVLTEPLINNDVLLFVNSCCQTTNKKNLRFGINDIFDIYTKWCIKNGKKSLKTNKFKKEFEKLKYRKPGSKGVDKDNNSGKRGYNIMVSL
jgi:hypothetical protein